MKKLICALISCFGLAAFATPVLFTTQSLTGTVNNRKIAVVPDVVDTPLVFGTNLISTAPFSLQPSGGSVLTNLVPWGYTIKVDGWPRSAHIVVPDTTNVVNAASLINTNAFAPIVIYIIALTNYDAAGFTNGNASIMFSSGKVPQQFIAITNDLTVSNYSNVATITLAGNSATGGQSRQIASNPGGIVMEGVNLSSGTLSATILSAAYGTFGQSVVNNGDHSFVEGIGNTSSGVASHSEGQNTQAIADMSHAEGDESHATEVATHAEGQGTLASGEEAHSEGLLTVASGVATHAEGVTTLANGYAAHAGGQNANATNDNTFVWSDGTAIGSSTNNQVTLNANNGYRLLGGAVQGTFVFTNAAGSKFRLGVNSTTNGFTFIPVP